MKTMMPCLILIIVMSTQLFSAGQTVAAENATEGSEVSISLDDVALEDFVRMLTRISDANISYSPELLDGARVTVNANDEPWKPLLETVLAEHKLELTEGKGGSGVYSIIRSRDVRVQELTGVLKKTTKSHSPYKIELDGSTGSFYLRGAVLKGVPEGTRISVKGEIKTELYDSSVSEGSSASPTHWQIFMDVKQFKRITKPFERTKEAQGKPSK